MHATVHRSPEARSSGVAPPRRRPGHYAAEARPAPAGRAVKGAETPPRRRAIRGERAAEGKPGPMSSNHKFSGVRASAGAGRHHLSSDAHEDRHAPLVDAVDRVLDLIGS